MGRNEDLEIKLFSSTYSIEMTLYNNLGEFEKAVALVPAIEDGLEKYSGNLNKVRVAYFCSSVANAYFGQGKFSAALKWNNRILHNKEIEEIEDAHCFAEIMNVIIHIELKNDDIIPYTMRTALRYLKSRKRVYKFETVFFNFINSLMKEKGNKPEKVYAELLKELQQLKEDPFEQTAFEYFDFNSWAESKAKKIPFREVVEEKARTTNNE
jgi:tellurite resistance protein